MKKINLLLVILIVIFFLILIIYNNVDFGSFQCLVIEPIIYIIGGVLTPIVIGIPYLDILLSNNASVLKYTIK